MKSTAKAAFRFLLLTAFVFSFKSSYSQIAVTNAPPYNTVTHLIQNVFLSGGVNAWNITYYGAPEQLGFFSNGGLAVGLDSGIVMSSGRVASVPIGGPFPSFAVPNGPNQGAGDPDLTATAQSIIPGITQTRDAAIIEFDFVPSADTLEFRYVFGSEEYLTWINTVFNDAFGFYISGPGITGPFSSPMGFPGGSQNIALVPGTTTPITISTIHPGMNSQYYITGNTGIQYNGYTTVLTATAIVTACDTFHMKLAVADGTDKILDTGVFLEARSFGFTGTTVSATPDYTQFSGDSNLYEGCGNVTLSFQRFAGLNQPHTVHFDIFGNAINGVDYSFIPDSIVIPAGQTTAQLTFNVISDGLIEGVDTIHIVLNDSGNVSCISDTAEVYLYINDPLPITYQITQDTTLSCLSPAIDLSIDSAMGLVEFEYLWSTGDTDSVITVNPVITTTYFVTITDACNSDTVYDSVTVTIFDPPFSITLTGDTINCTQTASVSLVVDSNAAPGMTYQWSTGDTTTSITVSPQTSTYYTVTVTHPCSGQIIIDSVQVLVITPPFTTALIGNNQTINCTSDSVTLGVQVTSNWLPGITFAWNTGSADSTITAWTPATSIYTVTTTLGCSGQTIVDSIILNVYNDPVVLTANNIPASQIQCPGDPVNIAVTASGGYPAYTYLWSTGATTPVTTVAPMTTTSYTVAVTDTCALDTANITVIVNVPVPPPLEIIGLVDDTINCPEDFISFGAPAMVGAGGAGFGYSFSWDNWFTTDPVVSDLPLVNTTYVVQMTDVCSLDTVSDSVTVYVESHAPLSLEASPDVHICPGESVKLGALALNGGGNYTYQWSNFNNSDSSIVSPNETTTYFVTVIDDCDTARTEEIIVNVEVPDAKFGYDYIDANTVQFTNQSSADAINFFWDFGDGSTSAEEDPNYAYPVPASYFVYLLVENQYGCIDSTSLIVDPPMNFWVPKAFSPNSDGLNDLFQIKGLGVEDFNIQIYNRWGQLMFESNDINFAWDGTYKGEKVPIGTYVWRIESSGFNKTKIEKRGTITLLTR